MIIRQKELLQYFLLNSLDMGPTRSAYWFSEAPSYDDLSSWVNHAGGMALHLLGAEGMTRDTIQDLVWLVSEYAHRELGVPGRLDVAHHLAQAARTEPSLHILKRYYRDHFFHVLEVCFLGHLLLEMERPSGVPFWHSVADHLGCSGDKQKVLRLWYVASLLHDVGYGVDVLKSLKKHLGFFQNAKPFRAFVGKLGDALSGLSKDLLKEGFSDPAHEKKPGEDHGVVGARHLYGLLQSISEDDDTAIVDEYRPAVRAIALHNSRKGALVSFRDDPLAFLLILCDTIQEWSRPRLRYETAPYEVLSWLRESENEHEDRNGPLTQIRLNLIVQPTGLPIRMDDSDSLKIKLEFNDDVNRNDQVFYLWLDASSNLQRLDFTGLDAAMRIDIEFITPFLRRRDHPLCRQSHRLRDAAHETHMGFLDKWFPSHAASPGDGVTNGAVTYKSDPYPDPRIREPREYLTLHLRELAGSKLITRDMEEFSACLHRWKNCHENLDFVGDYGLPEYPS